METWRHGELRLHWSAEPLTHTLQSTQLRTRAPSWTVWRFARRLYGEPTEDDDLQGHTTSGLRARSARTTKGRSLDIRSRRCEMFLRGVVLSQPNINSPGGNLRPRTKSRLAQDIGDVRLGDALHRYRAWHALPTSYEGHDTLHLPLIAPATRSISAGSGNQQYAILP
jgi:hypothetical protein